VASVSLEELHSQRAFEHAQVMTDGSRRNRQLSGGLLDARCLAAAQRTYSICSDAAGVRISMRSRPPEMNQSVATDEAGCRRAPAQHGAPTPSLLSVCRIRRGDFKPAVGHVTEVGTSFKWWTPAHVTTDARTAGRHGNTAPWQLWVVGLPSPPTCTRGRANRECVRSVRFSLYVFARPERA
jgi:hypothetical protein